MGPPGNCPHEPIPGIPGPGTACGGAVGYNGCAPCPTATHGDMAISRMPKRIRVLFIAKSPGESDGGPTVKPLPQERAQKVGRPRLFQPRKVIS